MHSDGNMTNGTQISSLNSTAESVNFFFALTITLINGLVVFSFATHRRLRKHPANIMICNQACIDWFVALVFIPVNLFKTKIALTLQGFLNGYMLYLSLFNLFIISADRYLATNKPFAHRRWITITFTVKMVVFVWVAPMFIMLVPLTWWFGNKRTKQRAMTGTFKTFIYSSSMFIYVRP